MKLKRGIPRESCDFCHRRKIKCDRSLRTKTGHTSCSQCALRQGPCHLNDPTETRNRRRTHQNTRGDKPGLATGEERAHRARHDISNDNLNPVGTFTSASHLEPEFPIQEHGSTFMQDPNDMFVDGFLGLSRDNIFFLDQIFMGDENSSMNWLGNEQDLVQDHSIQASTTDTRSRDEGQAQVQAQVSTQNPMEISHQSLQILPEDTDSNTTFTTAIHHYFKFAAPWLPIIHEDAFWEDYHSNRCSPLLTSAIACRGIPFTNLPNKWTLQQRFAHNFRESFLNTRSIASDTGKIRLDDLEALALMANFEYEESDSSDKGSLPLYSNLGRLFLKHESLVLMTLQYTIEDTFYTLHGSSSSSSSLARAQERRVLLYWHVYGLDAFHCLDRKQISLIPDKEVAENEDEDDDELPQHEARDFLDAILELSVIARKILKKLCSKSAKRAGIDSVHVHGIYALIYRWRNHTCPSHLRRYETEDCPGGLGFELTTSDNDGRPITQNRYIQLHRAVLWALEINCLMQVENYVSEFGIKDSGHLAGEIIRARVEYESLSALSDMLSICRWMNQHDIHENGNEFSLVDLAPLALRNVCAGLCFWICQRGITAIQRGSAQIQTQMQVQTQTQKQMMESYIENARLLRDTAAKAVSHRDTGDVLERLDKQVALFEEQLAVCTG
ncbi:hypothetical protein N7456_007528 [Penicillium angulare]|uniref:Zn(2)-C6 fungal-type domain-containing protein n=1 Tax=Penicillium angulare TaxID=116970 RepID=A0A9W9FAU7_9EURO|nr:hypothetical protein N7456_007528 [Penicillium angulare]